MQKKQSLTVVQELSNDNNPNTLSKYESRKSLQDLVQKSGGNNQVSSHRSRKHDQPPTTAV